MTCSNSRRKGFTLIELLVVIAIIAILGAILFPVFARARENARRTSCLSNLKQIGLGIMQYTQDNDETMPVYDFPPNGQNGWAHAIAPYLKSDQLFQCPSESIAPPAVTSNHTAAGYSDYAYNLSLGWLTPGWGTVALAALTQPTQTVMVLDNITGKATNFAYGGSADKTTKGLAVIEEGLRHLDGLNYLLADGHAKWYKSSSATQASNVWKIANCDPAQLNGASTFCYNIG